jgi:hypothetical protein
LLAASPPGRLPRGQSATPVIGYQRRVAEAVSTIRGCEDRNVAIEYRSAEEVFLTARRLTFRSVILR